MNWRHPARLPAVDTAVALWAVAVAFGVGDLVTTPGQHDGVSTQPRGQTTLEEHAVLVLTGLKATVFVGFFAVWKYVSRPYSIGVPLGLALLGVAVTAWNTGLSSRASRAEHGHRPGRPEASAASRNLTRRDPRSGTTSSPDS